MCPREKGFQRQRGMLSTAVRRMNQRAPKVWGMEKSSSAWQQLPYALHQVTYLV